MTRRFCRAVVRAAAVLVPARERERWRSEWLAEIEYSWKRPSSLRRRMTLTSRACDSLAHASWLRKETITVDSLLNDVRFAVRLLWRQKVFTAVAVLTLALGVGANTAIFSIVNRTLLQPLPFGHPETLMHVWETVPELNNFSNNPAPDTWDLWRAQSTQAADIAAYTSTVVNITSDGPAEQLRGLRASANLLAVLEMQPAMGRGFTNAEDRFGAPRVVLLTHRLWTERYAKDPAIVGRAVTLDGEPVTVTGILPPDVPMSLQDVDVWVPLAFRPIEARQSRMLWVVARAKPGVTAAALQKDLDIVMHRDGAGKVSGGIGVAVKSMADELRGGVRPDLLMIFAVSGVVLLIACTNVAMMLLARGLSRRVELSVRASLGAGRARLARALLVESTMLGMLGGAAGLLLGVWSMNVLRSLMPASLANVVTGGLDMKVLGFSFTAALVASIAAGVAPLAGILGGSLTVTGRTSDSQERRSTHWLRNGLVAAQMALAVVLLSGGALLARSFIKLSMTPIGFSSDAVLTAQVPRAEKDDARRTEFYARLVEALNAAPGVRSAAIINGIPIRFTGGGSGFEIPGSKPKRFVQGQHRIVSAGYFDVMDIPLLQGQKFSGRERKGDDLVVLVSQSFADATWPGGAAIGQQIRWGADGELARIIGVVADIRLTRDDKLRPHVYFPFTQVQYAPFAPSDVVIKTAGAPGAFAGTLRDTVRRLDPNQPVASVLTMDELLSRSMGRRRFILSLMGVFAGLALALCAIGIYGVLSYTVRRRTREIGLRIAIGASAARVRLGVLRQGLILSATGAAIGAIASALLAKWMATVVPGLSGVEPWPVAAAALTLVIVAAAACDIPARRAMRVDPMTALRDG